MNAMTCCAHDCNANACVTPECLQSYMNLVRKCTSYTSGTGARVLEENMTRFASKSETITTFVAMTSCGSSLMSYTSYATWTV
jgi:hypothetical protein